MVKKHKSKKRKVITPASQATEAKVSWDRYLFWIDELMLKVRPFKTLLMVGNNGFVIGTTILNRHKSRLKGVKSSYIIASHYNHKQRKNGVTTGNVIGKLIEPVLVIDDISDTGHTLQAVIKVAKECWGVKNIKTATLFVKPDAELIPNYFVSFTTNWVVFPWECEK